MTLERDKAKDMIRAHNVTHVLQSLQRESNNLDAVHRQQIAQGPDAAN